LKIKHAVPGQFFGTRILELIFLGSGIPFNFGLKCEKIL
jgi:hypothetical protein